MKSISDHFVLKCRFSNGGKGSAVRLIGHSLSAAFSLRCVFLGFYFNVTYKFANDVFGSCSRGVFVRISANPELFGTAAPNAWKSG
jgi:hypothetical protein